MSPFLLILADILSPNGTLVHFPEWGILVFAHVCYNTDMAKRASILLVLLLGGISFTAASTEVARDAASVRDLLSHKYALGRPFVFDAKITFAPLLPRTGFVVRDKTGPIFLWNTCTNDISRITDGDIVRIEGTIDYGDAKDPSADCLHANCLSMTKLADGNPDTPVPIGITQLHEAQHNLEIVSISGTILDVVQDEIDPRYAFLALSDGNESAYVPFKYTPESVSDMERRIGTRVSVKGLKMPCDRNERSSRRIGNHVISRPDLITATEPATEDLFAAPSISRLAQLRPSQLASAGRHKATGHVLAVWGASHVLVRTKDAELINASLSSEALPPIGSSVEIVGLPETDLYRLNLTHAAWRPVSGDSVAQDPPLSVTVQDILKDDLGRTRINPSFHGRRITLAGTIRSINTGKKTEMLIDSDGTFIPIEVRSADNRQTSASVGCRIEATGTCVLSVDNWRQNTIFPQIKGFLLVVPSPDGIRIVERPPWWTPTRLVAVIAVMLVLLVAILIWNASLRILSERKGRALFKAQESKIESELRVDERTRLATELHDYLAQNLTAISYQVSAVQSAYAENNSCTGGLLKTIDRMLQSCRIELRRCLWDLRSDTLNEKDFTLALRNTILPVSGNAALNIRFPVRRSRLSDTTAQAILSIVRELVSNSVRHGKASVIRIAGSHDDTSLRFSVFDNGSGFDPEARLGQGDGHFGLDGVSDRVKRLGGTFTIESSPDNGTKITVSIPAHPATTTT